MKSYFVFVLCFLTLSHGAIWRETANPDAGKNQCLSKFYKDLGVMHVNKVGYPIGECIMAKCQEDGELVYTGCSVVALPPNCKFDVPYDSLPFPYCCQYKYTCND